MSEGVGIIIPRSKLIQCFTCEYNLECWGLLEDIPLGKNERDFYPDKEILLGVIDGLDKDGKLNIAEYYGMISALFLHSLRFDHEVKRRDVYQLISLLCGSCNTDNDSWVCPAEDPEDDDNFMYVPR
jgi:hypothetical protein